MNLVDRRAGKEPLLLFFSQFLLLALNIRTAGCLAQGRVEVFHVVGLELLHLHAADIGNDKVLDGGGVGFVGFGCLFVLAALLGHPIHEELCRRHRGRNQEGSSRQLMLDLFLTVCCLLFGGKAFPFVAALAVLVLIGVADAVRVATLRNICHKFSDLETGYMDTIRDSIEDTAKDEAKKLRELPVYPYPSDHAREQGELDVYRASFRANVSCKDAIEAAIREHYRDNRLDAGAAVGQVAEQFGQERMLYVLAATVRHFDYDGRISRDNKRWANTIPVYESKDGMDSDRSVQFVVCSHPGLTDLFLTQARHEQRLRQPLTADEIKTEAARLLGKLQEPAQPNSPGGTHFMAEVSRDFMERAGAKDTAALQKLLPFPPLPSRPSKTAGACLP